MADDFPTIQLSRSELHQVTSYAVACARPALSLFERRYGTALGRLTGRLTGRFSPAMLHPLTKATQLKHILGAAAHAARAFELFAGDDPTVAAHYIA